ncbi:MAG: outer membrane lipoprotein-sorting protein [bacterium]
MKNQLTRVVLFGALFLNIDPAGFARDDSPPAGQILQRSERYRNAWESFSLHTRIENYVDGKRKDEADYEVLLKGRERSLVRFLRPDQKGQFLLMVGDDMWIYMPNTRRPIRITPLQRLLGDASSGDVARTNFTRDYAPTLMRTDTLGGESCYVLNLASRRAGATYYRIEYWVRVHDSRPVKAEFFLRSGKHYKTARYTRYEEQHGFMLLVEMQLIDRLRPGRETVMSFSSYRPRTIPDKYFNKNYLPRLR